MLLYKCIAYTSATAMRDVKVWCLVVDCWRIVHVAAL